MTILHTHSSTFDETRPSLSVLIPFFKDDAEALLRALDAEVTTHPVEILIYDDGTDDVDLTKSMQIVVNDCLSAVKLITNSENKGRSAARNALCENARGDWVLFLDADMLPGKIDFLQSYLKLMNEAKADVIFGGFQVEAQAQDADRDIHRALSEISDCLSLAERQAAGPQYVASSNLCMRRNVLTEQPFDADFEGWGWEDSEWAARVSKHFTLIHADNPAIHLGLETTDTMLRRFATSGANYRRFTDAHPDLAPKLALYQISKKLGRLPGQALMRPILKFCVKVKLLPMRLRLLALKLWRASHYAEALS